MTTTRTIKVLLDDYAPDTSITASIDGSEVFSGALDPSDPKFTFTVPLRFHGQKNLEIFVNKGIMSTVGTVGNYCLHANPVFTEAEFDAYCDPSVSRADKIDLLKSKANPPIPEDLIAEILDPSTDLERLDEILRASNVTGAVTTGAEGFSSINAQDLTFSDVKIDGVLQPESHDWGHYVYENSTFTAKINIRPGYDKNTSQYVNEGI